MRPSINNLTMARAPGGDPLQGILTHLPHQHHDERVVPATHNFPIRSIPSIAEKIPFILFSQIWSDLGYMSALDMSSDRCVLISSNGRAYLGDLQRV